MQAIQTTEKQIQKLPEPCNSWKAYAETFPANDRKILELKYASAPFGKMDAVSLLKNSKALLLRIHIITGWTIPANEFMNILVDQLCKKLLESYANVNTDEIEHAFRTRGTSVKDWGKAMNLSLFDEVMTPYLNDRYEVSKLEEQAKGKELQVLPPSKMSDQEIIDTAWDVWNVTGKVDYISDSTYEVLFRHSLIVLSIEQKQQLMTLANTYLCAIEEDDRNYFKNIDRSETQKRYAKKIAVARLFQEYKSAGTKIVLP